jgi:uncharacterized protein
MTGATAIWEPSDVAIFDEISSGKEFDLSNEIVSKMTYGGFVVPEGIDELAILREEYFANRYDPTGMILTIAPTLACNFGCDYCFQGTDKPSESMSQAVQDRIVQLVRRAAPNTRRLHVAWYGGEPLLALTVIESLSDRLMGLCDSQRIAYDGIIVTNGYRLTADVAEKLYSRQVKTAQITLDGASDFHDQRRTLLGGQPTFKRILENIKSALDKVQLRITIRINIDSRNRDSVRGLLDYLSQQGFGNRKNFGVYFAPVEAITSGCHCVADVCMSKSAYGQLEADLTRYAYNAGLTSLPYPPRFRGICGALRPRSFVVVPNGDLHKCWDTVSLSRERVGTVFDLDAVSSDQRLLTWMKWTPFENDTCSTCKILPNCAGSCAHKFVNADQTLGEAASLPCPSWKYNIKERLILFAEKSGAITSDDYIAEEIQTDPSEICSVPFKKMPAPVRTARTLGSSQQLYTILAADRLRR